MDGEQTLIRRTVHRLREVVAEKHIVVVVAEEHADVARAQLKDWPGLKILLQPKDAGTAAGVLLPLSHIRTQDPEARVVMTPSDHHFDDDKAFHRAVRRARDVAERVPAGMTMVGVEPDGPATDLGWIVPRPVAQDDSMGRRAMCLVDRFVEKPIEHVARRLFSEGGLWNTMIVAGRLSSLWKALRDQLPTQVAAFEGYASTVGTPSEQECRRALYRSLEPADFSRTVLKNTTGVGVVWMQLAGWYDCGTPERLMTLLTRNRHGSASERAKRALHALAQRFLLGSLERHPAVRKGHEC
jgi:mannose-1-phosphate guanylyltransferase